MKQNSKLQQNSNTQLDRELIQSLRDQVQSLEEQNRILDAFIENSTDAIQISDRNLKTIRINRAYEILTGLRRDEIVGVPVDELVARNLISESCGKIVQETKKPYTIVQSFSRTGRTAHVSCTPIFDKDEQIEFYICNDRDLNEISSLQSEIQKMKLLNEAYSNELASIKAQINTSQELVIKDEKMAKVATLAHRIARVDSTVLLLGETGTGKDEIAKFIHRSSNRSKEKFITINCGAITESLFESECFGYEPHAFTGAGKSSKIGLFEAADHGTLFLDEIGELPLNMQTKLLRVLQNNTFMRVGGTKPIHTDIRIIAATNRDLKSMVEQKAFREDLFYRLSVVPIYIPPLRERKNDIIPLSQHFLDHYNAKYGFHKKLSSAACFSLLNYNWSGNVRQLKNAIEQAVIISDSDVIAADVLPIAEQSKIIDIPSEQADMDEILEQIELRYLNQFYSKYGNVRDAAQHLHMSPTTFLRHRNQLNEKYGDSVASE